MILEGWLQMLSDDKCTHLKQKDHRSPGAYCPACQRVRALVHREEKLCPPRPLSWGEDAAIKAGPRGGEVFQLSSLVLVHNTCERARDLLMANTLLPLAQSLGSETAAPAPSTFAAAWPQCGGVPSSTCLRADVSSSGPVLLSSCVQRGPCARWALRARSWRWQGLWTSARAENPLRRVQGKSPGWYPVLCRDF